MKQIPTNGTCCGHAETLPLRYLDTQKLGYLYVQCYDLSYFDSNPMFQEHLRYSSSQYTSLYRTNFKVQQQQQASTVPVLYAALSDGRCDTFATANVYFSDPGCDK